MFSFPGGGGPYSQVPAANLQGYTFFWGWKRFFFQIKVRHLIIGIHLVELQDCELHLDKIKNLNKVGAPKCPKKTIRIYIYI